MSKVKWGILGTANIAKNCMIPGMKKSETCDMYAIAGRSLEKAEKFKNEYGFTKAYGSYQELLDDKEVQAVYIPLPNHIHLEWVEKALKAGKHVLCEKPLALNAAEAERMYATAKECGVNLMEAYAYLHSEYVESLKNDVKSGIIGNVDYIESAFVTQGYDEDFRLYKEYGGGAFYDLGCYCTTMFLSLIDSDVDFVKAVAEFSDRDVDFNTSAIFKFKNGTRASLNVGMILDQTSNSRFDRLYIHGSNGCIKSDVEYNQSGDVECRIFTKDGIVNRKITVSDNYSLEVNQVNSCILNGETPDITPEFSIKNAKLMDQVLSEIGYY